ncbi:adhesin biosynthesis transcription regulatory family protein [Paraglaciecola psychrophila]|nr:adhesin biosynthesis transcription regulatory family protein [Paraglaciecola psychrophila]
MNLPMVAGGESAARIAILLTLLPKLSENTCDALTAHFVNGYDTDWIFNLYGIDQPNFTRSVTKLSAVNNTVEALKICKQHRAVWVSLILSLIPKFGEGTRQSLTEWVSTLDGSNRPSYPPKNLKRSLDKFYAVIDKIEQIKTLDNAHLSDMNLTVTNEARA